MTTSTDVAEEEIDNRCLLVREELGMDMGQREGIKSCTLVRSSCSVGLSTQASTSRNVITFMTWAILTIYKICSVKAAHIVLH